MSLILFTNGAAAGVSASVVALPENNFATVGTTSIVYSGVKFGSSGYISEQQPNGAWSVVGTWLLNGTNSDFYIVRGTPSSTLTTDAGAGPLALSTDRIYGVQRTGIGFKTSVIDFEIQNVGTDVLASATYTLQAYKDI